MPVFDIAISPLIERLQQAKRVVVLTGAGVSAESGVATFRDPDGLWAKFSPRELASMDGFLANPERVREWYDYRRAVISSVEPNPGHLALARLEHMLGEGSFTLVTQNVDRLHQRAGSINVLEVHGNLIENKCVDCVSAPTISDRTECVHCGGMMRPNVVWFGENLPEDIWMKAERATEHADVFLSIGTSSEVYPAAGLPMLAKSRGAYVVEINPNRTSMSHEFHETISTPSGMSLPMIVEALQ